MHSLILPMLVAAVGAAGAGTGDTARVLAFAPDSSRARLDSLAAVAAGNGELRVTVLSAPSCQGAPRGTYRLRGDSVEILVRGLDPAPRECGGTRAAWVTAAVGPLRPGRYHVTLKYMAPDLPVPWARRVWHVDVP